MAADSSEMNELYGRGVNGKMWVLNGRLVKKEVKKEKEDLPKSSGKGIEKDEKMANAASSVSNLLSQPSSFNVIIHPLNVQPQLSVQVEERHSAVNGGDSLADELQQLKDALKRKELLNSMLMTKLEQVRKEKNEEQQKNVQLIEELKLARGKFNNTDKEMETEATAVHSMALATTTTLQPLRAAIAAQLLGVDHQLLIEPAEWKGKFENLSTKYGKLKRMYRAEQKIAAKLRKTLKDKEKHATNEEPSLAQLGDADQEERIEYSEAVVASPIQNEQHLEQQMVVEEEKDGENGRMQPVGGTVASRNHRATSGRSAKVAIIRGRRQQVDSGHKVRTTTEMKKKSGATKTVAIVAAGVFKCPQCPPNKMAFSSAHLLAAHQQSLHGDRQHYRHQCQECGLACMTGQDLRRHQLVHSGEKPHKCRECGREFTRKNTLTVHERVHTGERPFLCRVCQKAFISSSNLAVHARVHSGETPYSCQHCARQFNQASHCRRHEKTCQIRAGQATAE